MEAAGPEREIARDMARLASVVAPIFLIVCGVIWRFDGVVSGTLAFAIVIVNLLLGARIIGHAASISPETLMVAVLGGFVARLILLAVVVLPVRDASWFSVIPFSLTLVGGHLALLTWESRRVSGSLAYPGLPPSQQSLAPARPRSKS
jgi:hypothetical protein